MANGQVTTSGQGSIAKVLSLALVGLSLAASAGTMTGQSSNASASLTGQASTVSAGSVVQSVARALTGHQVSVSQGTIFANGRSLVLGSQGTAVPVNTQSLAGLAISGQTGLIFPNAAGVIPLVGSVSTSAAGIVLAPATRALTGSESVASAGTVTVTLRPTDPVGQAILTAAGFVSIEANNVTVHITGESILSDAGLVDATPILTGQASTSAAGTLAPVSQIALVGTLLSGSQGALTVEQAPSEDTFIFSLPGAPALTATIPLVGSASTGETGTVGITPDVSQALSGAVSLVEAGSLIPTFPFELLGQSIISAQENLGAPGLAVLSGQVITVTAGTLFVTNDRTHALTGSSSIVSDGSLLAGPHLPLVGVVLAGSAGLLGRSGGDMAFALTGSSSTWNTGTLGVIGQDIVTPGVSNEGCSIVSEIAVETEASPAASGAEGCFIQSGTAKEV